MENNFSLYFLKHKCLIMKKTVINNQHLYLNIFFTLKIIVTIQPHKGSMRIKRHKGWCNKGFLKCVKHWNLPLFIEFIGACAYVINSPKSAHGVCARECVYTCKFRGFTQAFSWILVIPTPQVKDHCLLLWNNFAFLLQWLWSTIRLPLTIFHIIVI